MGCLAVIFLPFVGLYKFIKWGFTSGVKGYIGLIAGFIVILVLILVARSFIIGGDDPGLSTTPDKLTAPYRIDTWSRTYYAEEAVTNEDGTVIMVNYWELSGEEWVFHRDSYDFGEDFGKVEITERR